MNNILTNPWIVGIGTAVIAGLILYRVFGIGRANRQTIKNKKVGILNEGENNQFINNTFIGMDIGIRDKGKKTKAKGNKFL